MHSNRSVIVAILLLLLAASPPAGSLRAAGPGHPWVSSGRDLLGRSLAGTWFDFDRELFFVIERTVNGYRVHPFLYDRGPDSRLVNRFEGLVMAGKLVGRALGFRGEVAPPRDPEGRRWRIEGSVERTRGLDRLDGAIRIEHTPFPDRPLASRRFELHYFADAPPLSVFQKGDPRRREPPENPYRPGELPIDVEIEYLPVHTDVEQAHAEESRPIPPPRTENLIDRSRDFWGVNRDAVW